MGDPAPTTSPYPTKEEHMGRRLVVDAEISYHITVWGKDRESAEKAARRWIKKNLSVKLYGKHRIDIENGTAYPAYTVEDFPKPLEDQDGMYGFTIRTDCL
jgi:hypothetical protein